VEHYTRGSHESFLGLMLTIGAFFILIGPRVRTA
jgi:hypothetical protein